MINILATIIALFNQEPDIKKMGFLSSFFKTPPDGFTDGEYVEYDITRTGMEIAPVVRNLFTGAVTIVEDTFTNKQIPFPVYALEAPANIAQLMTRLPGENAYLEEKVNWQGRLTRILMRHFTKMTRMIRFAIEEQAAQVLQKGTITLTDENGKAVYELDFKPKASHFPEAAVSWDDEGADPLGDISALADVIQADGYVDISTLVFGKAAWKAFYNNKEVREAVKADNLGMGALNPHLIGKGAKFMGYIEIGAYRFDLYLYNAIYTPWRSASPQNYIEPNNVIFLPDPDELDFRRLFGGVPDVKLDAVFDPIFGGKIPIDNEYDFRPHVYFDNKANTYIGEVRSRPALIPASIDRYGCLTAIT
jgi:hypothetical protein